MQWRDEERRGDEMIKGVMAMKRVWMVVFLLGWVGGIAAQTGGGRRVTGAPIPKSTRMAAEAPRTGSSSLVMGSQMDPSGLAISDAVGVRVSAGALGHVRYFLGNPDQLWARAVDTEFYVKATANAYIGSELRFHVIRPDTLDMINPTSNSTYLIPRLLLRARFDTFWPTITGEVVAGSQRRRGLGRYLWVKDVLTDGGDVTFRLNDQRVSMMWWGNVWTPHDVLMGVDWSVGTAPLEGGIYVVGGRPGDAKWAFDMGAAGLYGTVGLPLGLMVSTEIAAVVASGNADTGVGGLVSLSQRWETKGLFCSIVGSVTAANEGFAGWVGRRQAKGWAIMTQYPSLLDEEFDYYNYRTMLLKAGTTQSVLGWSVRTKLDMEWWSGTWFYLDAEYNQIMRANTMVEDVWMGSTGIKIAGSSYHYAYVGVQNRFSSSATVGAPLLNQVALTKGDPVVVMGVKFRF